MNEDGTLRLVSNWEQLTPAEREVTLRRLRKRNAVSMPGAGAWPLGSDVCIQRYD